MSRYIDCDCDNNLFALVITGNPTIEALQEAWLHIREQVAEISGSDQHTLLRTLYKEVCELKLHYQEILNIINTLKLTLTACINRSYNLPAKVFEQQKHYQNLLNKYLQSNFKFNIWDVQEYYRELNGSLTRAGSIKIKLDLRMMAYEQVKAKVESSGTKVKTNRAYYDRLMINISDYSKYEITEEISVSKFFERVKRYTEYCKQLQSTKK